MPTDRFSTEDIPILKGAEEKRIRRINKMYGRPRGNALRDQNCEKDLEVSDVLLRRRP